MGWVRGVVTVVDRGPKLLALGYDIKEEVAGKRCSECVAGLVTGRMGRGGGGGLEDGGDFFFGGGGERAWTESAYSYALT